MLVACERNSNRMRFWMNLFLVVGGLAIAASACLADEDGQKKTAKPRLAAERPKRKPSGSTHGQTGDIKISGAKTGHELRTFCLNNEGLILAIVGPPRSYNSSPEDKNSVSEIRVLNADGKELRKWDVSFVAHSISVAPNGQIFVAGSGKIAKFDGEGQLLATADAPHVAKLLKDSSKLRKDAEEQLAQDKEEYQDQVKQLGEQVEEPRKELAELKKAIDKKQPSEVKPAERNKIRNLEARIRNVEAQNDAQLKYYKTQAERSVDDIMSGTIGRLKIANALAVSDRDVFIATGVTKGFGYSIWRTTHEFEGADQIVTGLSRCCGQMDIRCDQNAVFVAENSRKRIVQYDRDGKKLTQWGEGDSGDGSGEKFGGCCNPMNLCLDSSGDVFTAESKGYIKRFTREGSFLGIIGQAKVDGGCKNVTIAMSPDGEKAYFYDLDEFRIVVLKKQGEEKKPAADKPAVSDALKSRVKSKSATGF